MKKIIYFLCFLPSLAFADSKLTALTVDTTAQAADLIYKVDSPGGTPYSRSITLGNALGQVAVSSFAASGVTAGSYTNSNVTINAQGIVTVASNGSAGGGGTSALAVGTGTASNFTNNITSPTAAISFNGNLFTSATNGTTNFVNIDTVDANGLLMISSAASTYLTQSSATATYLQLSSASATYQQKGSYLTSVAGVGPPIAIGSGTLTNFTNIVSSPAFALSFLGLQHTLQLNGSTVTVIIDTMSSTGVMAISSMTIYMTQSSSTLNSLSLSSAALTYQYKGTYLTGSAGLGGPVAVGTGTQNNFTNIISTPTSGISFNGNLFTSIANGTTNMVNIDTIDANGLLMISSAGATYITLSSAVATYQYKGAYLTGSGGLGAPIAIGTGAATNFTNIVSTPANGVSFEGMQFKVTNLTGTTAYVLIDTMSSTGVIAQSTGTNAAGQLVRLNSSTQLPALDGTLLTIASSKITGSNLPPGTSSYINNSPTIVAGSTASVAFAYAASSSTMNLLTANSTFYVPGGTVTINGLNYLFPNSAGSANNVLVTDGATPIQRLSFASTPNSAGVNVATQTISNSTNVATTELAIATVTITPTSTTSKIAVWATVTFLKDVGATARLATLNLRRGSSSSATGNVAFSTASLGVSPAVAGSTWNVTAIGVDTPLSTAVQTYTITAKTDAGASSATVISFLVYQLAGGGIGDAVMAASQTFSGQNNFTSSTSFTNVSSMVFSGGSQLVLSSQTTPTGPNEGQIFSNGDLGTMQSFNQGISGSFPRTLFASTGTYVYTNSTSISTINAVNVGGSGFGTQTLPAGFFQPGLTVEVFGMGIASTTANPTLTTNLLLGTTSMANTTARTMGTTLANVPFKFDLFMTCQSTGSAGTIIANGEIDVSSSAVPSGWQNLYVATTTAVTLNTTVSNAVNTTFLWGTANISNTIKVLQYWIRSW